MRIIYYKLFCFLRVVLTVFPETGYIHPDEFFQGPEVVYGDLLGLKVHKTWEFTSLKPIRSVVFPFFITGAPTLVANMTGLIASVSGTTFYPYLLIVLPRFLMCCLTFILDILIYKICKILKQNAVDCLVIYASSYVTLTYLTRTLSNSLETLFFALLIFFTVKLFKTKEECIPVHLETKSCKIYFSIGIILAVGVFNRPTFIAYSFFPFFILLFCIHSTSFKHFTFYFLSFLLGVFSTSFCLCFLDTVYYKKVHYSRIDIYKLFKEIIITPFNFILYNLNSKNLSVHGLHPVYLHLLVNIPLLFSVYGFHLIMQLLQFLRHILQNPYNAFNVNKKFFFFLFFFPLALLSLIPHQEPRFIVPLLFPLVLSSYEFLKKKYCLTLWYVSNLLCLLFYGFFHQGGVYLSSSFLHTALQKQNNSAVVFYKTYMPPRFLLGITDNGIFVHDFAGANQEVFKLSVTNIAKKNLANIFIVIPFEVVHIFENSSVILKDFKLQSSHSMFPHLSTESLPELDKMGQLYHSGKYFSQKINEVKKIFSIHVLIYEHR